MSVIATCGHELTKEEDMGVMIATPDQDRMGNDTISYPVLCNKCLKWYGDENLIIEIL